MEVPNFKVGDIVVCKRDEYSFSQGVGHSGSYRIGRRYKVVDTYGTSRIYTICLLTGHRNGWGKHFFELDINYKIDEIIKQVLDDPS